MCMFAWVYTILASAGRANASMLTPAAPAASAYMLSWRLVDFERLAVLRGPEVLLINPPRRLAKIILPALSIVTRILFKRVTRLWAVAGPAPAAASCATSILRGWHCRAHQPSLLQSPPVHCRRCRLGI